MIPTELKRTFETIAEKNNIGNKPIIDLGNKKVFSSLEGRALNIKLEVKGFTTKDKLKEQIKRLKEAV